jgi:hypothetical protein
MAFIPALGLAGAGISAIGSVLGGISAGKAASYSSQVAANNAIIAGENANYAIAAGNEKAATESLKSAAAGGKIKVAQAANGVNVNTGTAVDVQADQREAGALNSETVLNNSQLQAYGYRSQQTGYEAESALDTEKAETAPIAGDLAGAGGLLGSASSIGTKWVGAGGSLPGFNPIAGVTGQ